MKLPRRNFLHLAAGAAALPAVSRITWAQTYPTRPITIVVPFPAGGPTDTLARIMADHMRTSLGQSVIIENVTGGGGSVGVGRVAPAAPDGYTVSIGHWSTHVVNGASLNLPYDVLNDFEPSSGQIKAYAMMTQARWWAAPDVPTMEEAGVPGLYASFWHGLWVPKGTPKNAIARLNSAVRSALADPAVRQRFADQGQQIPSLEQQSPEALGAHQQAEIKKWWPIIKAAGIKAM